MTDRLGEARYWARRALLQRTREHRAIERLREQWRRTRRLRANSFKRESPDLQAWVARLRVTL